MTVRAPARVLPQPQIGSPGWPMALAVSACLHAVVVAVAVGWMGTAPTVAPDAAFAVEVVFMSPDPGGHAGGGATVPTSGKPASDAAASTEATFVPNPDPPVAQPAPDEDATAATDPPDTLVTEAGPTQQADPVAPEPEARRQPVAMVFTPPPQKPFRLSQEASPAAPLPKPARPSREAPQAAPAPEPEPDASKPERKNLASDAGESAPAAAHDGHNDGTAGAILGPRFRLGGPGNPLPRYPEKARRWGQQGLVVLSVAVSAKGDPLSVSVFASSGYGILDRAALNAVRRWRFRPVLGAAGAEVAIVHVPISFRLEDRVTAASATRDEADAEK